MKQIVSVIIITIILITISIYSSFYLKNSAKDIGEHIHNIQIFAKRGDWDSAYKELILSQTKWDSTKGIWAVLIEHQEIDNVEISMSKLTGYIESKDSMETLSESLSLELIINHVPQNYGLNMENVF